MLLEMERHGYGDLRPRLWTGLVPIDLETRSFLLCELEGDTPSGRVGLYHCPICFNYGCGVVSVRITRFDDDYVWSDFCFEEDVRDTCEPIERLGPFRFHGDDYRRTLVNGIVTQA